MSLSLCLLCLSSHSKEEAQPGLDSGPPSSPARTHLTTSQKPLSKLRLPWGFLIYTRQERGRGKRLRAQHREPGSQRTHENTVQPWLVELPSPSLPGNRTTGQSAKGNVQSHLGLKARQGGRCLLMEACVCKGNLRMLGSASPWPLFKQ